MIRFLQDRMSSISSDLYEETLKPNKSHTNRITQTVPCKAASSLSVETINSIVEDIIDLLQDKSNLSLPYRSVFVISSSCFFKMLSSIFLIFIKRDCLAD